MNFDFNTQDELLSFLKTDKEKKMAQMVAQKKFEMKRADAVCFGALPVGGDGETAKAAPTPDEVKALLEKDSITVRSIINTTNLLDSHGDVHIKGLWKKSLSEQRNVYLLNGHVMDFEKIISDTVKASAQMMTWKELGVNAEGETQALVFDSEIRKDRNPYMFEQYARGYVKNHSVGMRYIKMAMAVNSGEEYYKEEKKVWDKYIDDIVNREEAEAKGYFWAVTEAKFIEGSAVVMGSNWATPTQSVKNFIDEPPVGTHEKDSEPDAPLARKSVFKKLGQIKN